MRPAPTAFVAALAIAALLAPSAARAINATYAKQLERSGCTQVSEAQGCNIKKTKDENARAGFVSTAPAANAGAAASSPYTGRWVARSDSGATVATIRIDAAERVRVNGKPVKAKRSDGGLVFSAGTVTFRIQGDRRLKGEDTWTDRDAGTQGPIAME